MNWYYADAGRQVGPVDDAALDELVGTGVVRPDTLVWREGMANWQPHSAVRGPKPPPPMPAMMPIGAGNSFCSECGRPFPSHELVMLGTASVCAQCKPIYLQRIREGGQGVGVRRYAGFWIRFVALIIDGVITGIAMRIIAIPLGLAVAGPLRSGGDASTMLTAIAGFSGLYSLIGFAVFMAYEVFFLSTRGATPGKMLLGLKVIRADGLAISPGLAAGRCLGYVLDEFTLFIGFIMAGFDSEKRALHDRLCDTRVIYVK